MLNSLKRNEFEVDNSEIVYGGRLSRWDSFVMLSYAVIGIGLAIFFGTFLLLLAH
jgi:hypothetical protein